MSRHHYGARIKEFTAHGFRTLALENEVIRVEVVLDKGADITSFLHKPTDTEFMWHRPGGLRSAPFESIPRGVDESVFVDNYEGGWQECFPNGGMSVSYKGAQLPFHGELITLPHSLEIIEDRPERVAVRLAAETIRTPFRLEKVLTLEAGSGVLTIDERLENLADEPMDVMWGHHPAVGPPFLDDSCRIDLPDCVGTTDRAAAIVGSELEFGREFTWPMAPRKDGGSRDLSIIPGPESKIADWVRLTGFEEGWYGITNGNRSVGFGLRWDASLFGHLWFWHVFGGLPGYPWYGRNYNFALEPWTSYPDGGLTRAIENGSARVIEPLQVVETRVLAVAYSGTDRIRGITETGDVVM